MKKIIKRATAIMLIALMSLSLFACGGGENGTIKLFIPGEYMSTTFITDFEKEYNCKVIVEYFDSNEMMYTKVQAGDAYDVLVPSDYMIERLLKENALQKLDRSVMTNFDGLSDKVLNISFDPDNEYSIPYFWGNVGIVYNHNNVDIEDLERENFDIFRDTKYRGKLYMYDSERDGFMMAFKQLGYSCNSDVDSEIMEAYNWLVKISETMDPIYVTDEVIDGMMNGYKDLALVYSGDAATILAENEDMSFYVPTCGTNFWVDAMVIPANAENPSLANKFINYAISYQTALDNTLAVGYASPVAQVLDEMTAEEGDFYGNNAYLPVTGDKDEVFHDNEYLRKRLSELWIKVMAAK